MSHGPRFGSQERTAGRKRSSGTSRGTSQRTCVHASFFRAYSPSFAATFVISTCGNAFGAFQSDTICGQRLRETEYAEKEKKARDMRTTFACDLYFCRNADC